MPQHTAFERFTNRRLKRRQPDTTLRKSAPLRRKAILRRAKPQSTSGNFDLPAKRLGRNRFNIRSRIANRSFAPRSVKSSFNLPSQVAKSNRFDLPRKRRNF